MSPVLKSFIYLSVLLAVFSYAEGAKKICLRGCKHVHCPLARVCTPGEIPIREGPCGCCRSCIRPIGPVQPVPDQPQPEPVQQQPQPEIVPQQAPEQVQPQFEEDFVPPCTEICQNVECPPPRLCAISDVELVAPPIGSGNCSCCQTCINRPHGNQPPIDQ